MKKKILGHIEHVKQQPHHVRKQVIFTAAAAVSVFIGFIWLVGTTVTGGFAVHASSFAALVNQGNGVATTSASGGHSSTGLAGAAAALQQANTPAHIEVVDTTPKPSTGVQSEQTVIPF